MRLNGTDESRVVLGDDGAAAHAAGVDGEVVVGAVGEKLGKDARIPQDTEDAAILGARDEEAEAVEGIAFRFRHPQVGDGNGWVLDLCECLGEWRRVGRQERGGVVGGNR